MKQKARSNLFVVAGTQFLSAARLKGGTAKQNEKKKKETLQLKTITGNRTSISIEREENKANIAMLCRTSVQVSFVQCMAFVLHATIHDRHTPSIVEVLW